MAWIHSFSTIARFAVPGSARDLNSAPAGAPSCADKRWTTRQARTLRGTVLAGLTLALAACIEKAPPAAAPVAPPKLVRAWTVIPAEQSGSQRYSGEVRARYEMPLAFRIGGKLLARQADVGAVIKPGQVLARLDPADVHLAAVQAEANRSLAAAELKRTRDLRGQSFISQAALDGKETAAKAADAQAALARNQANYAVLVAEAPGVIAAVLAESGQVVNAGQAIFRLARDGEREVAINIPESRVAGIKLGADATVSLWAAGSQAAAVSFKGILRELAPVADPATRTFAARVSMLGEVPAAIGLTASVSFAQEAGERLLVPLSAIFQQGDRPAVWVIGKDNALTLRVIEIDRYADDGALVKAGLVANERIVAAGAYKLTAGEPVRVAEDSHQ